MATKPGTPHIRGGGNVDDAENDLTDTGGDDAGTTLLVHPGIGTKEREFVEVVPPSLVERDKAEAKEKDQAKNNRCTNCRRLLKAKREFQDEVQSLQAEVNGLRTLVQRMGGH